MELLIMVVAVLQVRRMGVMTLAGEETQRLALDRHTVDTREQQSGISTPVEGMHIDGLPI